MYYYLFCFSLLVSANICNGMNISLVDSKERALSFQVNHTRITVNDEIVDASNQKFITTLTMIGTLLEQQYTFLKEQLKDSEGTKISYETYKKAIMLCAAKMDLIKEDFLGKLSDYPIYKLVFNKKNIRNESHELMVQALELYSNFYALQKELGKKCLSAHRKAPTITCAKECEDQFEKYVHELSLSISVDHHIKLD